uniref:Protein PIH1D3 n=2 Tax=Cacopsylla melanoneura TaxID=428564 RepID=A0A8D8R4W6_9HEMI
MDGGLFNASDLQCLSNLLNPGGSNNNEGESDEEEEARSGARGEVLNGGGPENPRFKVNIRRVNKEADDDASQDNKASSACAKIGGGDTTQEQPGKVDPRWTIWEKDEIPTIDSVMDQDISLDPRAMPHYDIMYQQAVSSEDIYLQMGGKTPSSVSCEDMLLTVHLPNETRSTIDCDVTTQQVQLRSVHYRLSLPLPHAVLPHLCTATWDPDTEQLKLTLRLTREFDYVNF